jgi:hypothetical protein
MDVRLGTERFCSIFEVYLITSSEFPLRPKNGREFSFLKCTAGKNHHSSHAASQIANTVAASQSFEELWPFGKQTRPPYNIVE